MLLLILAATGANGVIGGGNNNADNALATILDECATFDMHPT